MTLTDDSAAAAHLPEGVTMRACYQLGIELFRIVSIGNLRSDNWKLVHSVNDRLDSSTRHRNERPASEPNVAPPAKRNDRRPASEPNDASMRRRLDVGKATAPPPGGTLILYFIDQQWYFQISQHWYFQISPVLIYPCNWKQQPKNQQRGNDEPSIEPK